jgi:hypothetical protein
VDVVLTEVKPKPVTSSSSQHPEEPPILFAAANRLQAELNSSPSSQPQPQQQKQGASIAMDTGSAHDEAPILFAAANRIQQQQQKQQQIQQQQQQEQEQLQQLQHLQQQQQQQLELNQQMEIEAQQRYHSIKDAAAKQLDGDAPILFSPASRLNQDLGSPILFSAASRMIGNGISSSSSSAAFSGGLTTQDTAKLPPQMTLGGGGGGPSSFVFPSSTMSTQGVGSGSISATTSSGLSGLNHKDLPPPSTSTYSPTYTPTGSLNMVMTPQGEIGKSDMSLAFEVMDRCTIDLLLLQQRYATVTSRLTEVTAKALESDARLAQLGAQMELELKMSRVHHEMKNGFEQQQLPDLQRMMRSTQELISRLGHLSTTAAAGSATSVVVRPQLRKVPTVAGGGGVGSGVGGAGGSLGAIKPSVVALALDRLAQTGQHTLSTTTTTTTTGVAAAGDSYGDVRFSGMANINSSRNDINTNSSDMDIDRGSEIPAGGVSSVRNPGTTAGTTTAAAAAAGLDTTPSTATATEETVVVIRPCLSFNIAPKGCRFRASNHPCPYLHTCLYCGSSSHAVMHCDYTSAEPSHDNFFR